MTEITYKQSIWGKIVFIGLSACIGGLLGALLGLVIFDILFKVID